MWTYPVSVKGVVARNGHILLVRNERGEWEPLRATYPDLRWSSGHHDNQAFMIPFVESSVLVLRQAIEQSPKFRL
jgi:hypothetical protein